MTRSILIMCVTLHPDVIECAINNGGCEHNCINLVGSRECSCQPGYTLERNGFNCSGMFCQDLACQFCFMCFCLIAELMSQFPDIDECQTDGGGCTHDCTNTLGSFECSCPRGFSLDNDGLHCNGNISIIITIQPSLIPRSSQHFQCT